MTLIRRGTPLAVLLAALLALVAGLLAVGPTGTAGAAAGPAGDRAARCPQLQLADHWYGDNAARIQRAIDERGRCSWGDDPPARRPYAVFDWDNTVIKNDISDQTLFWMLRHDKVLQPPGRDWHATSRWMTDAGAAALRRACGSLAAPGRPLPTSTNVRCADEILAVRLDEETTDGDPVFGGRYDHRQIQPMYAWVGQILQGYTRAEVRHVAARARRAALRAPIGATQEVGSQRLTAWIRYYPEIRDLISTLQKAGIEPWVVSASPKEFADVWGRGVGIDRAHTIGVLQRTDRDGVLNGHLESCGGVHGDAIMTYVDGKRCFINQQIVGLKGPRALEPAPYRLRPVVAGGDANTDVSMVQDATGVHVVLNRNGIEIMCKAYDDADGRWAPNPMFIQPLPKRTPKYPCSTTGYVDSQGDEVPVRRPDGSIIPDQVDRVHG